LPSEQPAVPEIAGFIQSQRALAESGHPENIRRAFIQLSQLYEHRQLGETERAMMQPILDMLALQVIYARDTHILEPPYRVKPGETIESIARDFDLTPTLLRKINGLPESRALPAGTTLKVLYGQFDAQISIKRQELTLLLGGLYAGRFSFSFPHAGVPMRNGEFYVTTKTDQSLLLNNGWILATANTRNATLIFADHNAREIFDILSEQSVIVLE
jgi:transposase-like protein